MKAESCSSKTNRTTNLFIIYHDMNSLGGLQSVAIRLADSAVQQGKLAHIACRDGNILNDTNDKYAISIEDLLSESCSSISSGAPIEIISLAPLSAAVGYIFACQIQKKSFGEVRFSLGVYHPRDFNREQEKRHLHFLNFLLSRAIGLRRIFFMNEETLRSHEVSLKTSFSNNPVIPVPIDSRPSVWKGLSDNSRLRIVCVGRIVSFKAYNFSIPEIVANLVRSGHDVSCDIYGYGTDEDRLHHLIEESGVSEQVRFMGAIPLQEFDSTVSKYDVFIGMGTAALQAAQLGVPTIVAIDRDADQCYGFLHEVPFGNVGECNTAIKRRGISGVLKKFIFSTPEQKMDLSRAGIEAANYYSAPEYIDRVFSNHSTLISRTQFLSYYYCLFYVWMTQDNMLKRGVRLLCKSRSSAS